MTLGTYMFTVAFGSLFFLGLILMVVFFNEGNIRREADRDTKIGRLIAGLCLLCGISGLIVLHPWFVMGLVPGAGWN